MKTNYQVNFENIINKIKQQKEVPTLLLHSCCAPCSSYVLTLLSDYFKITILYYNPNIEPFEEYQNRLNEQKRLINELPTKNKINFIETDYNNQLYHQIIDDVQSLKEGGNRCFKCYEIRLNETARLASKYHFDYFTTTLSVSPYKNSDKINEIGEQLQAKYSIPYLYSDFKKKEGYKSSIVLAKKYNLYRQNYCGCLFFKNSAE